MYPKIKFRSDPNKDIRALYCFIDGAQNNNGRHLNWAILKKYLFFKSIKTITLLK